ncbi:5-formyltetrahydrofolate cyclo-ligase [Pedobacter antarcticus]|uniref:5-formyltetrahydrofolate cyclo-ligase n=1 Tax=Pedobacter antarcticus TaxID=34086 RepID=UPI00292EBC54|nr:5-formyltetrahydrofolate cyclo-ligase [Pedobacter antarcticus]
MALKSLIRKQELLRRKILTPEKITRLNEKLLKQFCKLDFSGVRTVHLFLPIEEKNEPDTFLFIDWLRREHPEITIVIPRADFETSLMTHHVFAGREMLQKNKFQIWEPIDDQEHSAEIDLVLVPLLAVDVRGYRVGYGKGFYDRFLEASVALKVGVSFFAPEGEISDVHENDIRLDCCLTPDTIVYF